MRPFGEIAEFRNGVNYVAEDRQTGIGLFNVKDFQDRARPDYDGLDQVALKVVPAKAYLQQGDILFVRSNGNKELIGRSLFLNVPPPEPVSHSAFTIRARITSGECYPQFYALYCRSGAIRRALSNQGSGTNISNLNQDILARLPVPVVPYALQRRIADILSAYDDLIENNTQRIATLEDMARRLFEEWSAGNVGGSRVPFSDLADFINGFAFKPAHLGDIGYPVVKIPELQNGVTGKTPFNDGAIVPPRNHINTGDLLFSWSGTFAVKFWIGGPALLNQHLFKVVPNEPHLAAFLLIALRAAMPEFLSESVGATMKHIRRGSLSSVTCASPHGPGGPELCASLGELYSLVNSLRQTNTNLRTTRDLLLPKLISGEIEVRTAEEELEAAAA